MNKYLVVARVVGKDYLVNVEATSNYVAEHEILDKGVCGKHYYGVEGAQAFGEDEIGTDTFKFMALRAQTISKVELLDLIDRNNQNILLRDRCEKEIEDSKKKIEELQKIIEEAEKTISSIDDISNIK